MIEAPINHLVVYGTLMVGQRANKLLDMCSLEGTVWVPGVMFDLMGFPGVKLGGKKCFRGELWRLPRKPLARTHLFTVLDRYEGSIYKRRTINVVHAKRDLYAHIYELTGTHDDEDIVPSGCWDTYTKECDFNGQ